MKNWNYIDGAKVGNADNWRSYDEMIKKAKHDLEVIKQKEREAASFSKKQELASARREIEDKLKYYQKQTGNDTPWEYAHRKPKVINEDKTGAEEFFKKLSDDVKEREEKDDADIEKVGNREIYVNQSEQTKAVVYEDGTIMLWDKNGNNYKTIKAGSLEEARKKLNSDYKKVGNALNWDENLVGKFVWVKDKGQEWKVYVMQDKGDKVYIRDDEDGSQGWVSKTRITGKVGNAIGGGVQSETVLTETKDGSQYWVEKTSKSGQYAQYNLYYTIGQGKRHAGVFKDKEAAADAGRRIISNSKAKNEAPDDKFTYVMREFNEGKLKTPDGKVITDPAQAKAIAYSESKKTENGLARAFNALAKNKKVKNSAVREYKHSDGRVAQIDFNEDGSDADMSIYDGNSNKELEHKNFSTIRDAEQYVTSHGFKRI